MSIFLFFGIFLLWSALAPLDSAAIAPGILQAQGGSRKTVQHLEGGIIQKIAVKEGQIVRAGDILVQLDTTRSNAQDDALQSKYDGLEAQNARLLAEMARRSRIDFPASLSSRRALPHVQDMLAGQEILFERRRQSIDSQLSILDQRIRQSRAEIDGYQVQIQSTRNQSELLGEEIATASSLVERGYERKSRLLALQRQQQSLQGQLGQLSGNIARVERIISEAQAQKISERDTMVSDAASEQRSVESQLNEVREQLKTSGDIRQRRDIRAPVEGRIVNLRLKTTGGVVTPGEEILDIVPQGERIVVLARLKANDVESVQEGMAAEVRLLPYKARLLPLLKGTVQRVAADVSVDERSGQLFYETEIVLDPQEVRALKDVRLISGMPTQTFISLGERSLLTYLVQPLLDSFEQAFREP